MTNRPTRLRRTLVPIAALLLACALGCAVNPATGKREFTLVTADQELALGQQGYGATLAEYGQYDDAALGAYVDSVGQKLARASELPNLQWHFTVLDDPAVNAFAMPGGYIYITRGILAHLNSEAQLAGVLGHEIGHVTARHSAKQMTQQQLAGLGLAVATTLSPTFAKYGGTAQQALGLMMLKYSRDDESQADALGIRYATAAGWDPREIPATYAMLKRIGERAGSGLPFYLSTHPDPGDREERTRALAAQAATGRTHLNVRAHGYLEHVRGIVFGDDPRGGYVAGTRVVHPRLGYELDLPAGWTAQPTHAALAASEPQGKGALQLGLASDAAALAPADYVAALRANGRIAAATGEPATLGGWPAWLGRVQVAASDGTARTLVAGWVRLGPDRMLQCLGTGTAAGDDYERAAFAALRTLAPLADAHRRADPERVRVVPAPAAGAFLAILPRLGSCAIATEDAAILNGLDAGANVTAGQWLKTVEPGRR